ncbi:DUF1686 domain-containing protein [Encephalitozoon hellem]|uniref:DUF1686 domain-containing protein n=2 Tax=Encephalitozoon hellem TaxID=27973 RepID=A0A9Q9F9G1_ENCHE|nr:DUF1686 domain-containing protein [Encephalitozoon hellem]
MDEVKNLLEEITETFEDKTRFDSDVNKSVRELLKRDLKKLLGISELLKQKETINSSLNSALSEKKAFFSDAFETIANVNGVFDSIVENISVDIEDLKGKNIGDIFPSLLKDLQEIEEELKTIQNKYGSSDRTEYSKKLMDVFKKSLREIESFLSKTDSLKKAPDSSIFDKAYRDTFNSCITNISNHTQELIGTRLSSGELKENLIEAVKRWANDEKCEEGCKGWDDLSKAIYELKDSLVNRSKEIVSSDVIENVRKIVQDDTSSGIVERVIQKIKGLEIGGVLIGLVIVLLVYCTMEETAESSTKAGKGLDRGLYYVSVIGGLAYLVWVVGSSYCYDEVDELMKGVESGTRWKGLTGVMSMVPIVVGVLSVGGESREGITIGMVSAGVVAAQHFVGDEMRWREIVAAAVGSGLVCVVYFDVMWNFLGDGVGLYYVWTLMVVFVCMLVGGRYMWRESFRIGAVLRYVVFMVTLVVSTAISWSGVCVCPSVSGYNREID